LTPAEVRQVIFEGFFPATSVDSEPQRGARTGLHEMGLPYVSDPAVTRHLAAFVRQHLPPDQPPGAILYNGGVFQPASLRDRLLEILHQWYDRPGRGWQPLVLTTPSLDLAVAWGAAYYGWLRHTGGKRIGGGIARSYYIAIESAAPTQDREEKPVATAPSSSLTLLCVVPQHLEEGNEIRLDEPELELALGQPVSFPLYSSTVRRDDHPGQILQVAPQQLLRMPPLHTILRGGKRSGSKRVPVTLAARLTEIGTLELFCVARNSDNRWRLEFNTRDSVSELDPAAEAQDGSAVAAASSSPTDVWPEELVQAAAAQIHQVYADRAEGPVKELTRNLEKALDASRVDWPTGLCRRLWDFLAGVAEQRRLSPAHLSRWYNLVGFSLRPGFGDALDRFRVEQLWKIMHAPVRQEGSKATAAATARAGDGGADYWIMWRRVAGGLNLQLQQSLFDRMRSVLLPSRSGKGAPYRPGANELVEMWRAAASLERLDPKVKELLGQVLLRLVRRSPVPSYGFWSLTRLGSRRLFYGPLNTIVHPHLVEDWLEALLPFQPGNDDERRTWTFCLSQLAFRTNQRALDINDELRQQVIATLRSAKAPGHLIEMVEKGGELESGEQKQFFGEALPIGLRLLAPSE
jgi:hypothetical protein